MFGINGSEFVVLAVLVVLLVGPERMPEYAEQLGRLVRSGRKHLDAARKRVDDEMGDDLKDVDWAKLDPRQYDPRRIVREALLDDPAPTAGAASAAGAAAAVAGGAAAGGAVAASVGAVRAGSGARQAVGGGPASVDRLPAGVDAPYDDEAT
ncbi:sec-independent protein translocase protein TatB [Sediminihabitans luteus]|uniref:Sec-independent protein translocase protein TatB n=1 Tax=Sediminihabitans luteus TaxID=1138585 RepID=A0A2M9CYH9_9CELL|nr:Sec-independent protein translocase TatB [Sediminihabitans luteus]PJJ76989.1 sec-independent protein translocase protein TatB [Sediminihabitans luteus]GII99630.1 hypothetical protein Slu03_20080 [Sediminihabitans luteus]